jgi:hypothetical protein
MARDNDAVSTAPLRKGRADEDDVRTGKQPKPMPAALAGAIMFAFAWGFLALHGSCLNSTSSIFSVIQYQRMKSEMREQMRGMPFEPSFQSSTSSGEGLMYTLLAARVFQFFMAVVLVAGAALLLMRKGIGRFVAVGAPVGMMLVEIAGFGVCMIITKGTFLVHYNVEFIVNLLFSLIACGVVGGLVFTRDVGKALS